MPCAKSAANALMEIGEVAQSCDKAAEGAVKAAERAARDVVALRCMGTDAEDREAFYVAAEKAFDRPLGSPSVELCDQDRELKALLTLAYCKLRR